MTADELQSCHHCGWEGIAHLYNLVWTLEWACPSCTRLHRVTPLSSAMQVG